jgi:hypothetical protein
MRKMRAAASRGTHRPCVPSRPCRPSRPTHFVGHLGQCVRWQTSDRRIAFGAGRGGRHFTLPPSVDRQGWATVVAAVDGTRRGSQRRRCGRDRGSERTEGARRTASAFWRFAASSRRRDGKELRSCLDHSRSRGVREDGQFGHLDKVFGEVGTPLCELRCESKTRIERGFSRIGRMIADKKLV